MFSYVSGCLAYWVYVNCGANLQIRVNGYYLMRKTFTLLAIVILIIFISIKLRNNNKESRNAVFNNTPSKQAFSQAGLTKLHIAVIEGDSKTVSHLLDNGADVNYESVDGTSPLHSACSFGQLECVEILLEHGANIEVRDARGDTPLSIAALAGQPEIVELLLTHGAKTDVKNDKGNTPLQAVLTFEKALSSNFLINAAASKQKKKLAQCAKILKEHSSR